MFDWHSGRARWIFIHIPKNAGVAIRKAPELAGKIVSADPYFHVSRTYTRALADTMRAKGEHHGFQHARWRDLNPRVTARLQPVAVLRNPWARTVSRWRFAQLAASQGKAPAQYATQPLEAFLEERHIFGAEPFFWHRAIHGWYPQADYVTDDTGALRVDLLRQEALSAESQRYFGLTRPVARRNVSSATGFDYRTAYDARTIRIVADWYARDIDLFGFDFDTAATRNTFFPPEDCAATPQPDPAKIPAQAVGVA
ncbi:hypothetical protein RNZ50_04360 [Paracoccaceae bacterium Fryx2]|nr:hypothetical protein [Paracoccaceae bacterium Fryx2]